MEIIQNIKRNIILYFNFLPCLLRNKIHIDMELGFNPFLEDLTDQTSQNDLLANNCQKKIDPARPVEPGTLRVFNWG